MRVFLRSSVAGFVVASLLVACGGGGGGDSGGGGGGGGGGSGGPAPLSLSSSVPSSGSTGVSRTTTIALTFSAALDVASVTSSNVTLASPAGPQAISTSVSGTQLTVMLPPSARLGNALLYTLSVPTTIRGAAGETPVAPLVVTFRTEDGVWGPEMTVSTSPAPVRAANANIAADANGGAVVAWTESSSSSGPSAPWGARTDGSGVWHGAQPLGGVMSPGALVEVAADDAGNGFVVWSEGTVSPYRLYASRFQIGGVWSNAAPIDAGLNAVSPVIAADSNGNAIALWSNSPLIYSNRYSSGAWGAAAPVNTLGTPSILSRYIGMDAAGNAIAIWDSGSGLPMSQVNFARYSAATGAWVEVGQIPTIGLGVPQAPQIAVDAAGSAIAVWSQHDGMRSNLWASRFVPTQGWGTPESIEITTDYTALSDLATDALGNTVAVWIQGLDGACTVNPCSIFANRYRPGLGWAGPEAVETTDANAIWATATVERGGNTHVAWQQGQTSWINRYEHGVGWRGATSFVPNGGGPSFAVSANGRVYAAYSRLEGIGGAQRSTVKVRQFE